MTLIADTDTRAVLARLKDAILDQTSLRGLAARADELGLEPPEAIHHSVLSEILNSKPGRNLYLQTLLSICEMIETHPAEVLFGRDIGLAVSAMQRLTASERAEVLSELGERLAHHRGTVALRKKLAVK